MKIAMRSLFAALVVAAVSTVPAPAHAQAYPSKPVRIVVPYSAGGPTDAVARALATKLGEQVGQPVIVENRTGAGGNIGSEFVAKSPPDGYTVLYHSSGVATSPALYKKLNYDPVKDLTPVALTATIPLVLMAHPSVPAASIQQFIAYLKANPSKVNYGSGGVGSIPHLAVALFLQVNGVEAVHVPYKGNAPATTDLIGGQIQFMVDAVNTALPYIRDNRVRALAVTSQARASVLPGVPTVNETVTPNFSAPTWHGVFVSATTPQSIVQRLNAGIAKAVLDPEMKANFASQGVELLASTPEQLGAHLRAEIDRWTKAAKTAGVQPE